MNPAADPLRFRKLPRASVCRRRVPVAVTARSRLLGLALLGRGRAGEGLLIPRCRSVHTFGMRFALDLVFCDRALRPLAIRPSVPPNRFVGDRRADCVLELPVGRRPGRYG